MIDTFCILFSTGMCLVVVLRALQLDRLLPWFKPEPDPKQAEAAPLTPPGRVGGEPAWRARAAATPRRARAAASGNGRV